jgi:VWFA-related protein
MKCLRMASFILLAALGSLPWLAAETVPGNFAEAIDVRVVNVEAVVTGRDGERVRGLAAQDFRLLVDGREVPIEFFTEIVEGAVASPAAQAEGSAAAAVREPEAVGRSVLVFIDDSFSIAPQRNQVLQQVERSLSKLSPSDRVAIVAFDGRQLELLSDWTDDDGRIAASLANARQRRAYGQRIRAYRKLLSLRLAEGSRVEGFTPQPVPTTMNDTVGGGDRWGGGPNVSVSMMDAGFEAPDIQTPLTRVVTAAAAAMRGLPAPQGRKVMLVLSGGWPLVERESFGALLTPVPAFLQDGLSESLYRPLVDTANLLGYTLYPVDVPGLDPSSTGADAEAVNLANFNGLISSEWERSTHYALDLLAQETGGKAALNSARLEAMERMVADTGTYYWLGFTPAWRADDQRHQIELRTRRPGLKVRSRSGFSDLSRQTEMAMSTEGLLLFGGSAGQAPEGQRIKVEMGRPRRTGPSMMSLPVVLHIPAEALTAVPVGGKYVIEATLALGALDRWGGRSDLPVVPLRLTTDRSPRPGDVLRYRTVLKMRHAQQRLVFTLRDSLSGEMLWANLDYKP